MSDMSFVVRYTGAKTVQAGKPIHHEKHYPTQDEALTFCVVLLNMGGEVVEMVQCIGGCEDAVLDGPALNGAIARQRVHIEQDAEPPWL